MVAETAQQQGIGLFPRQRRFVNDERKYPAAVGGIGSGKTYLGAAKTISRLTAVERGMIVAPTFDILRMATLDTFFAMLDLEGLQENVHYTYNKNEKEITFAWGHRIVCRSAERYQNLRGPNLDYCWVDEAALLPAEAWKIIKGRIRIGRNPQAWLTFTPHGRNWAWEEWERDATGNELDPIHPLYRFATTENPTLPETFVQDLGYEGSFYQQEIGGQFVSFEGLVYSGFSRNQVVSVDCSEWLTALALDIGTRNPTALLSGRYSGDRIHIERELYRRGMSSNEIVDAAVDEYRRVNAAFIVVDPSAAGLILDLQRRGLHVRKAKNDVIVGIQRVTAALPDLTVDESCVNLIAEFESYQYPDGTEKDAPIKANDHALDALRYLVMELSAPKKKFRVY